MTQFLEAVFYLVSNINFLVLTQVWQAERDKVHSLLNVSFLKKKKKPLHLCQLFVFLREC